MSWHDEFKEDFAKFSNEEVFDGIEKLIDDFHHIFNKRANISIVIGDGRNARTLRFQVKKSVTIESPLPLRKPPERGWEYDPITVERAIHELKGLDSISPAFYFDDKDD